MPMSVRRTIRISVAITALLVLTLIIAVPILDADQYQALAAAVQAVGVVGALTLAALTFLGDSHDRRVDRALHLNELLTSGELNEARSRLLRHLERHHVAGTAGVRRIVSVGELTNDPTLKKYTSEVEGATPRLDVNRILRFMERANAARRGGIVDERLFHELIGRHAAWFSVALSADKSPSILAPLLQLGSWANSYAASWRGSKPPYVARWGESRVRDFGVAE